MHDNLSQSWVSQIWVKVHHFNILETSRFSDIVTSGTYLLPLNCVLTCMASIVHLYVCTFKRVFIIIIIVVIVVVGCVRVRVREYKLWMIHQGSTFERMTGDRWRSSTGCPQKHTSHQKYPFTQTTHIEINVYPEPVLNMVYILEKRLRFTLPT